MTLGKKHFRGSERGSSGMCKGRRSRKEEEEEEGGLYSQIYGLSPLQHKPKEEEE